MAIEIIKEGRERWRLSGTCSFCGCEFKADLDDMFGVIDINKDGFSTVSKVFGPKSKRWQTGFGFPACICPTKNCGNPVAMKRIPDATWVGNSNGYYGESADFCETK